MGFVATLSTLSTFFSSLRLTVFSSIQVNWKLLQWVLSWHWQMWVVAWSGVWILVILQGTVAAIRKREATINALQAEIDALRAEADVASKQQSTTMSTRQVVNLSMSLRTEQTGTAIMMGTGQDSSGQPHQIHVAEMTLMIYNHGDKPVVLRGCKIWKLHAAERSREIPLYDTVTSTAPAQVNITEPLVRVISTTPTLNFTALQGKFSVRIVITFCEGSTTKDVEPRDFELECKPWRGSGSLRIDAREIPSASATPS